MIGGFKAGDVYAKAGVLVDDAGFKQFRRELDAAKAEAKKGATAKLEAKADTAGMESYRRSVRGADTDSRHLSKTSAGLRDDLRQLGTEVGSVNRQFTLTRNVMGLVKPAALITALGLAAQAANALAAGGLAIGSALGPLVGLMPAGATGALAMAQGMSVAKLATSGLSEAYGGNEKALAALTPEAQKFVGVLHRFDPLIARLRKSAQAGLFPGLTEGLEEAAKNAPVVERLVKLTSETLGRNAARAGTMVGGDAFGKDLELVGERNVRILDRGARSGLSLADAFRHIVVAAGPLTNWLSLGVLRFTHLIDQEAKAGRESGRLGDFFAKTRDRAARLWSIVGSLASGFYEVTKAASPLGDDVLKSIDKTADRWETWTKSVEGKNSLKQYFDDARPTVFEAGRLIHDVVIGFLGMGSGPGPAKLIRQLRVELLPVLLDVIKSTTEAFGPALIRALVEIAKLLGHLAGTSGPLTLFVETLATAAHWINVLLDSVPGLNTAVITLAGGMGIYKALQIGAAVTGMTKLLGLTRGVAAATAATGAAGALTKGSPLAAAGRGGALGALGTAAGGTAAAIGGIAAIGAIGVVASRDKFHGFSDGVAKQAGEMRRGAASARDYERSLERLATAYDKIGEKGGPFADDARKAARDLRGLAKAPREVTAAINSMRDRSGDDMEGLATDVRLNMKLIRRRMDVDSNAGKRALSDNFQAAAYKVRDHMRATGNYTKEGMAFVDRMMRSALAEYGITGKTADRYLKGGDFYAKDRSGPQAGKAEGGYLGAKGMVSGDVVDVKAAWGEAFVNRHQIPWVERAFSAAHKVGAIPFRTLDALFAAVRRPHHMASGGRLGAMVAKADEIDKHHYPYKWGGGHGSFSGPYDCSGAVSAVLHAGGALDAPRTSGGFMSYGKAGDGPVTLLTNPGHIYMRIGGRYFGTSGANPGGGAGWFDGADRPGFMHRAVAAVARQVLKRVRFPGGGGGLSGVGQGVLDADRRGAQHALDQAEREMFGGSFGGGDHEEEPARRERHKSERKAAGGYIGAFLSTSYGPPWGGINGTGVTRTGVNLKGNPHIYGIAVDPAKVRLGSKVKAWPNPFGYRGAFRAFDTGGAIKGNRIDFYDWRGRARQMGWGRRQVKLFGPGHNWGAATPKAKSPAAGRDASPAAGTGPSMATVNPGYYEGGHPAVNEGYGPGGVPLPAAAAEPEEFVEPELTPAQELQQAIDEAKAEQIKANADAAAARLAASTQAFDVFKGPADVGSRPGGRTSRFGSLLGAVRRESQFAVGADPLYQIGNWRPDQVAAFHAALAAQRPGPTIVLGPTQALAGHHKINADILAGVFGALDQAGFRRSAVEEVLGG